MQVFIVVGYNNTRVSDVVRLRHLAKARHGAGLVLVAEAPSSLDSEAADRVVITSLAETLLDQGFACVTAEISKLGLRPIGILPFSDRGVLLGARLAEAYSLPGSSPSEAKIGIDKQIFRQLDQETAHPAGYRPVGYQRVTDLRTFTETTRQMGGMAFVKPAREGASRGCCVVRDPEDCAQIWPDIARYAAEGIIVEELVSDAREYSWDYVDGASWITEKETTNDSHRAEIQQIVPAPLDIRTHDAIDAAGRHMRQMSSVRHGAYHNEVFLRACGMTSAVEVNMRPGGMHIWDLARLAFLDFDPWVRWLDWSCGQFVPATQALKATRYSGIRMLRAPRNGTVRTLPRLEGLTQDSTIHDIAFSVQPGASVSTRIADNHAFIGHVIASNASYADLKSDLLRFADALEQAIEIE